MGSLKKLLKAAAIAFALFAAGILLAAVLYPDADLPDWYSLAVFLIPFAAFILLLARNKPRTAKEDAPAPSPAPQAAPSPPADAKAQHSEPVSPAPPAGPDAAEAAWHSGQRNTFSAADFADPDYPDNAFSGEGSSRGDDMNIR